MGGALGLHRQVPNHVAIDETTLTSESTSSNLEQSVTNTPSESSNL